LEESKVKVASYIADGKDCYGVVVGDGVVTMKGHASLREALAAGALDQMRKAAAAKPDHKLGDIRFLPAIPDPRKILCAGINYRSHAAETGRDLPVQPSMFIRFADTLVGHEGEMIHPTLSDSFDFEGELAIVIGRGGRHIRPERALDHVAGYTCFIDGSVRDYQRFSVTSGKNWPGSGPLGPWIVTTDEIPDPGRLTLTTRLNGREVQHSGTDLMIHSCPQIVAFCSDFTVHGIASRRRDRHRHARRRRPRPQAAALDEGRRPARSRDHRHRHAAHEGSGREGLRRSWHRSTAAVAPLREGRRRRPAGRCSVPIFIAASLWSGSRKPPAAAAERVPVAPPADISTMAQGAPLFRLGGTPLVASLLFRAASCRRRGLASFAFERSVCVG
jgi:2-keto-4-pentenoate hydratase/2-oxohepta-3-ene-1,7-dioic acid hydratase in catechol pathway